MAVPKKIAQKARAKLKRRNNGELPQPDEELHSTLRALESERLSRQRHHLMKQLQQVAKKSRALLLRKLVRREATGDEARRERRMLAAKRVPPAAVARRALTQLGLECPEMGADEAEWEEMRGREAALCNDVEGRLLAAPAMQALLEKLQQHAADVREHEARGAAQPRREGGDGGGGDRDGELVDAHRFRQLRRARIVLAEAGDGADRLVHRE